MSLFSCKDHKEEKHMHFLFLIHMKAFFSTWPSLDFFPFYALEFLFFPVNSLFAPVHPFSTTHTQCSSMILDMIILPSVLKIQVFLFELISCVYLSCCWQKSCQGGSSMWPRWPSQRLDRNRSFKQFWRPSMNCWGLTAGPLSGVLTVSFTSTLVTCCSKQAVHKWSKPKLKKLRKLRVMDWISTLKTKAKC